MYENGSGGVVRDEGEAVKWYLKAAEHGDADRLCKLGFRIYDIAAGHGGENVHEWYLAAARILQKASEHGIPDAQYRLGYMYSNGQGVRHDNEKAIDLYQKAAKQGNADAQYKLGEMYEKGKALMQNLDKALELYREAAEHGNANAQYRLGTMYKKGIAVKPDEIDSLKWFGKAAGNYQTAAGKGDADAQYRLGCMYYELNGFIGADFEPSSNVYRARDIEEAFGIAARWFKEAAKNGRLIAKYKLGMMYWWGMKGISEPDGTVIQRGVAWDRNEALKWFEEAAEEGYVFAQNRLGDIYSKGEDVTLNYAVAANWYRKAAAQGNASAKKSLDALRKAGKISDPGRTRTG